jgi:hypothetical protein
MSDVIEQPPTRTRSRPPVAAWTLRILTAASLAIDAFVHADLAARYDANQGTSPLSQGDLFRIEALVSALVALTLLVTGRTLAWVAAWLVAASAVGAMLLYRYHDPGALGPLPDMYEPLWFREKTMAGIAEGIGVVTASFGLLEHLCRSAVHHE